MMQHRNAATKMSFLIITERFLLPGAGLLLTHHPDGTALAAPAAAHRGLTVGAAFTIYHHSVDIGFVVTTVPPVVAARELIHVVARVAFGAVISPALVEFDRRGSFSARAVVIGTLLTGVAPSSQAKQRPLWR
jgi:hypothetical protein